MKIFVLNRKVDVSGISGTGVVAEGVQFTDGQIVLSWLGQMRSIEVHPHIQQLMIIHGHQGKTELIWQ